MKAVVLKNGTEEADVMVTTGMMALESVMKDNPIAFYELVMKCRDPNHQFFGNTGEILKSRSLVEQSGNIHDSVRNIVLSAVSGDEFDMRLSNPVAD